MSENGDLTLCNIIAAQHKNHRDAIAQAEARLQRLHRELSTRERTRGRIQSDLRSAQLNVEIPKVDPPRNSSRRERSRFASESVVALSQAVSTERRMIRIAALESDLADINAKIRATEAAIDATHRTREKARNEKRRLEARYAELDCPGRILR